MSKQKKDGSLPLVRVTKDTEEKIHELAKKSRREISDYLRLLYIDAIIKQTVL